MMRHSCGASNRVRISSAWRIVSQSDLLPMITATNGSSRIPIVCDLICRHKTGPCDIGTAPQATCRYLSRRRTVRIGVYSLATLSLLRRRKQKRRMDKILLVRTTSESVPRAVASEAFTKDLWMEPKSSHARSVQYRARKQAADRWDGRLITRAVLYRCPNVTWPDLSRYLPRY